MTPELLWRIPRVGAPAPAPSGAFVVVGVTTHDAETGEPRQRLHLVPTGLRPRQGRALTSADVSASAPAVSPDGMRLAFLRKAGGERQLHILPLDGGEAQKLTDLPLGVEDYRWFPDGKRLAVVALLRAPTVAGTRELLEKEQKDKQRPSALTSENRVFRFWDRWLVDGAVPHVFVVDAESGEMRDLTPEGAGWFDLMDAAGQLDVSPDGAEIVFSANASAPPHHRMRFAIFAVPTSGGPVRCLTPDNPQDDIRPRYTPDGRSIVYGAKRIQDHYADRVRLVRYDRQAGTHTWLTEDWDSSAGEWELLDAETIACVAEVRGASELFRVPVGGGAPISVARGGTFHLGGIGADGHAYLSHATATSPPEVARVRVAGGDVERLSSFTGAALEGVEMGRAEEIDVGGVATFLVYPPGHDASRPAPLLHNIHGGPYGMHGDGWHWRWNAQTFAAAGWVVAMTNFHGSSSYGQRFSDAIFGDWGGKAADDLLAATDELVARKIADPARMAIAGGSFGGYMTLWLATRTDRFACAIAHAAVFDLVALTGSDVTLGLDLELGAPPWALPEGREKLDRWDPAAHVGKIVTPTLVIHGEKDYRVPVEHAYQAYGSLQARQIPSRLVIYPDENHWIAKRANSLHWYREFFAWLDRWVKRA
jgi:dipeptidyl aminopeptidase/acylaminoacyl peptidase